jgi:hypothetical protein
MFLNGSHGPSAVALDNVSGDIVIIPSPPPGKTRMLFNQGSGMTPVLGSVAGLVDAVAGDAILVDAQGNETAIGAIVSAVGVLMPATATVLNTFLALTEGEYVIYRPAAPVAGNGVFLGAWVDTDLVSARASVDATLRVIAQPPPGKTWSLPIMLPAMANPYDCLAFYNFDVAAGHSVDLFLNDGTNDMSIEVALAVPIAVAGPPVVAGEGISGAAGGVAGTRSLIIPDGYSLKAIVTDPPVDAEITFKAPFAEYNTAKV